MALSKLSGDVQRIIFRKLYNVVEISGTRLLLNPGDAVAFSSASSELRALTKAELLELLQLRKAWLEAAARKAGKRSYKKLSHAKSLQCVDTGVSADDLATLGTLCGMLPKLQDLRLIEPAADGVQWLAEKLGAGALPAVTLLRLGDMHVGDAGASALSAALGRGALSRLKHLHLHRAAIGDAGLVALAPALRRLPALECLDLYDNPLGDEGLAALLAPPPPAGAPPPPPTTGGLAKLKVLWLGKTQITDAGCATLAAARDSGALPALDHLSLILAGIPASAAAKAAVYAARANLSGRRGV